MELQNTWPCPASALTGALSRRTVIDATDLKTGHLDRLKAPTSRDGPRKPITLRGKDSRFPTLSVVDRRQATNEQLDSLSVYSSVSERSGCIHKRQCPLISERIRAPFSVAKKTTPGRTGHRNPVASPLHHTCGILSIPSDDPGPRSSSDDHLEVQSANGALAGIL